MLVIKIEPDEGISMRFEAKVPGPKEHIRSVFMDFNYGTGFGVQSPPAYERLIGDAIEAIRRSSRVGMRSNARGRS